MPPPPTYMNASGRPVAPPAGVFQNPPDENLRGHDAPRFPPGAAKLKQGGGVAGHNGLKDIGARLGSLDFWRLRLGIGHPGERDVVDRGEQVAVVALRVVLGQRPPACGRERGVVPSVVVLKNINTPIGYCGLIVGRASIDEPELAFELFERVHGNGYATEAARAAVRVAFDGVGLAEIWSMTAVLNEPSKAVMRRLGMTEAARFNHPKVPPGHPIEPHVAYHLAAR